MFDSWFLTHQAAPVLNRVFVGRERMDAVELAKAWERQMGGSDKGREQRVAKLEPASAEFLTMLEREWIEAEKHIHA